MKQSLWIIALLLGAAFAYPAFADTLYIYDVTSYDGTSSTVDGNGSFTYDPTALINPFSDFNVTWDGVIFNLTSAANDTPSEAHGCDSNLLISVFTYLTNANCQEGGINGGDAWLAFTGIASDNFAFNPLENAINAGGGGGTITQPFDQQGGVFAVALPIPEPQSVFLLSTALLAVAFLARNRKARA
jgi:hypothetical protein